MDRERLVVYVERAARGARTAPTVRCLDGNTTGKTQPWSDARERARSDVHVGEGVIERKGREEDGLRERTSCGRASSGGALEGEARILIFEGARRVKSTMNRESTITVPEPD